MLVQDVVAGYLDHLAVERGTARNTLDSYARDLRRYVEHLGDTDFGTVTEPQVAEFLAVLREGDNEHSPLAASSAARALVAVRGLHKFALREGIVDHDPAHARAKITAPLKKVLEDIAKTRGFLGGELDPLDLTTGKLKQNQQLKLPSGAGPRHLTFHPNGRYAYILEELR
ncbi:site-specific integrase, partial [Kibdelosporangium lantanae]